MEDNVNFVKEILLGGFSITVAKTVVAPLERVKILLQVQDATYSVRSKEVLRFSGIKDCFKRVYHEQGLRSFWRGNLTNCLIYLPTCFYQMVLRDKVEKMFRKQYNHDKPLLSFALNTLCDCAVGCCSTILLYPLHYARTQLAADTNSRQGFKTLTGCLLTTYKTTGLRGIYSGYTAALMGSVPFTGLNFALYDTVNRYNPYRKDRTWLGLVSKFVVANLCSIYVISLMYPFETVRRRLQIQGCISNPSLKPYSGVIDCIVKMVRDEGLTSLFKGYGTNFLRYTCSAWVMVVCDNVKQTLRE